MPAEPRHRAGSRQVGVELFILIAVVAVVVLAVVTLSSGYPGSARRPNVSIAGTPVTLGDVPLDTPGPALSGSGGGRSECRPGARGTNRANPRGERESSGVGERLLENGTVTPKASAGVSRDTSSSIPHGETPSGTVVHRCRNGAEVTRTGGSPISHSTGLLVGLRSRWRV